MESGTVAPTSLRLTTSTRSTVYIPSMASSLASSSLTVSDERTATRAIASALAKPAPLAAAIAATTASSPTLASSKVNHESPFISAVTGSSASSSLSSSQSKSHVLTIQISQESAVIHRDQVAVATVDDKNGHHLQQSNDIDQTLPSSVRDRSIATKTVVSVRDPCDVYSSVSDSTTTDYVQTMSVQAIIQKPSSVGDLDMNNGTKASSSPPTYLYYMMPSGQCSPSDTMDSGTCSDLETSPPPLPKKLLSMSKMNGVGGGGGCGGGGVIISDGKSHSNRGKQKKNGTVHSRCESFTDDSEESESSLSYDSLNSTDLLVLNSTSCNGGGNSSITTSFQHALNLNADHRRPKLSGLPDSLLRDIRDRSLKLTTTTTPTTPPSTATSDYSTGTGSSSSDDGHNEPPNFPKVVGVKYASHQTATTTTTNGHFIATSLSNNLRQYLNDDFEHTKYYENDKFYNFHMNERVIDAIENDEITGQQDDGGVTIMGNTGNGLRGGDSAGCKDDESFVGYRDIHSGTSTIRSSKGTVRGVKNRVRNGIATFLQLQQPNIKSYKEKDAGKVVLYTTSMGIVRETYAKCANVKQILRTLLVKFEERDVFMSLEYQQEIKDRMQSPILFVPQLFVDGQHIGDANQVERLNESGELRQMLKIYKSLTTTFTCQMCGGYRLLPCPSCKGSKKSVHRNHFTTEFVALKCMNCDEVGLVKCYSC